MAGSSRKAEKKEPIVVVHEIGGDVETWRGILEEARERSVSEGRTLVIVEKPRHTAEERSKIERRIAGAAADLIRKYLETMEMKIAAGSASAAETDRYNDWKARYIKEA